MIDDHLLCLFVCDSVFELSTFVLCAQNLSHGEGHCLLVEPQLLLEPGRGVVESRSSVALLWFGLRLVDECFYDLREAIVPGNSSLFLGL